MSTSDTPEPTPTFDDAKTEALIGAVFGAEECRSSDPLGRVCQPCWGVVLRAADAIAPREPVKVLFG